MPIYAAEPIAGAGTVHLSGPDGAAKLASPEAVRRTGSRFHPGGQGNGIFQLIRAKRNGREHLFGSQGKSGEIIDFTTGEVVFDFTCFGPGPILAADSYETVCAWYDPIVGAECYVFGGWVKAPATVQGQNEYSGKHSYVIRTFDFNTWDVLLNDGPLTTITNLTIVSSAVSGGNTILTLSAAVPSYIGLNGTITVTGITGAGATAANGTWVIGGVAGSTITVPVTTTGAGTGGNAAYVDSQTRWKAELSDVVPLDITAGNIGGLYWFRADINTASPLGDENVGVFNYQGGAVVASVGGSNTIPAVKNTTGTYVATGTAAGVTRLSSGSAFKGALHNIANTDRLYMAVNTNSMLYFDVINGGSVLTSSTWAPVSRSLVGGTLSTGFTNQGAFGRFNGKMVMGQRNGIIIGSPGDGSAIFLPLFVANKVNATGTPVRAIGWRSKFKECLGGLVFAANVITSSANDDVASFLLWLGPGGVVKVLDANVGSIAGIEIYDGKLYYGVTTGYDYGQFSNYRLDQPMLASIPLDQIKTRVVPYKDTVAGINTTYPYTSSSGVSGTMGGWPTFGYTAGRLRFESDTTGTLTIFEMGVTQEGVGARTIGTVAVTGGTPVVQDLTNLSGATALTGNPIAFSFSVSAGIKAEVYFH